MRAYEQTSLIPCSLYRSRHVYAVVCVHVCQLLCQDFWWGELGDHSCYINIYIANILLHDDINTNNNVADIVSHKSLHATFP